MFSADMPPVYFPMDGRKLQGRPGISRPAVGETVEKQRNRWYNNRGTVKKERDAALSGRVREEEPLIIAVCIDGRGGMLFNRRRQSQDRAQREDLLRFCGGRRLWVAPYSAPLFGEREEIRVDEEFLEKAEAGEVCFVEDRPIAPAAERMEALVVYDWDRAYPADVHLDFDPAAEGFALTEETEFPGSSHGRIIRRIYEREADHGGEQA